MGPGGGRPVRALAPYTLRRVTDTVTRRLLPCRRPVLRARSSAPGLPACVPRRHGTRRGRPHHFAEAGDGA